jgi:hypothetical protein
MAPPRLEGLLLLLWLLLLLLLRHIPSKLIYYLAYSVQILKNALSPIHTAVVELVAMPLT